jgi:hypothetical protein
MKRADIDDKECERFVTALKKNKFLVELDMSENLIGFFVFFCFFFFLLYNIFFNDDQIK